MIVDGSGLWQVKDKVNQHLRVIVQATLHFDHELLPIFKACLN
jgi:hypothetical protein